MPSNLKASADHLDKLQYKPDVDNLEISQMRVAQIEQKYNREIFNLPGNFETEPFSSLIASLTTSFRGPVERIKWNNLRTFPAFFASSISSTFRVHQASRSARTLSFTWCRMMRRVELWWRPGGICRRASRKDTVLSEIECLDEVGWVVPQADAPALSNALDIFSQWPFISDTVPSGRHSRSCF
ncbi:hypothetical protein T265_05068 [Opisthorchis viverrini]|uniref:Uncharacterized protein n=1 Tax=Opisthorchis viverrini TaxID=6198 RepID=A0A074ZQC2_OPIVI|nr:hypothetical protein T265_05068 [Opisthorchis viverrini]KER28022.1 hypothetical protein T265_05068 [Opisthorchis viverrini]